MREVDVVQQHAQRALERARFAQCIFYGFGVPTLARLQWIAQAGFDVVILGMNHQDDDTNGITRADLKDVFKIIGGRRSLSRWNQALDQAHDLGLEVWLMPWARTTLAYNETARATLEPMTDHPAVGALVHDTEVYWHRLLPDGVDHAQAVEQNWLPVWGEMGVDHIVTDYAYAPESILPLLPHMSAAIPQAYSRASWIPRGDVYRAGKTQAAALRSWRGHMGTNQRLIVGCAAYDQSGHPGGIKGGMTAQYEASTHGDGIAWWSYKSAGTVARRVMAELNKGVTT